MSPPASRSCAIWRTGSIQRELRPARALPRSWSTTRGNRSPAAGLTLSCTGSCDCYFRVPVDDRAPWASGP